jgi:methenyltetrahydromethanopterin cyclohydrolase
VTLSLNHRAMEIADRLAADAEAARLMVTTLSNGTRLIDCGAAAPGGFAAGRRFAEMSMGGLGTVGFTQLAADDRWLPAVTVVTDHPALACLGSQYAGWKLERDDYFAMASGPGRALIRAEELYDDLDVDERASAAVLCLETREAPSAELAADVARRAGVDGDAVTLALAPTASIAGGVQVAARVVETALHKLHALHFDVSRVMSGFGSCPLPPVARTDVEAIGRTNDAVLYGGHVELTLDADDAQLEELAAKLPASASRSYGKPFGEILREAGFDFYAIDPLLFSPAEVRLTSTVTGRSFQGGRVDLAILERSFWE